MFSSEEKHDIYIQNGRNAWRAVDIYQQTYPERRQPHRTTFARVSRSLLEHGSFKRSHAGPYLRNDNVSEINVLAQLQYNPENSSRKIAIECGVSDSRVRQIIKQHKFHDYKFKKVNTLHEGDPNRRLEYCNWFLQRLDEDNHFPRKVLWTDESLFTNSGIFNRRNLHYYATENPHLYRETRPQNRFSLNVWAGILNNAIVGPFFLDNTLNGRRYLNFLQTNLEEGLDHLYLENYRNLKWFQQDGCGAHNARVVRDYLDTRFPNSWMGTFGPVQWPPRSPSLNPLDYYLWGHLKDIVYSSPTNNIDHLRQKILAAFESVQQRTLQKAVDQMTDRINLCIENQGRTFEQFL